MGDPLKKIRENGDSMKELGKIDCLARYLAENRYDILSRMLELLCKNIDGVEPQDIIDHINIEKGLNIGYDIIKSEDNYTKISSNGYDKTSRLCNSRHGRFEISIMENGEGRYIHLNLNDHAEISL